MPSSEKTEKTETRLLAVVEGGGTSFRVAVCRLENANSDPEIIARDEFDSSHDHPKQTLAECVAFFQKHNPQNNNRTSGYDALGIATFGPVGVDENHPESYGHILASSPKAVWRDVDFLTPLKNACQGALDGKPLPVLVETDVNAPALAEYLSAKKEDATISSAAYITVGTGVGVGLVVNGQTVHGRMHPEGGHIAVHPLAEDTFPGYSWGKDVAPFGGIQTVEGIASTVALTERLLQRQEQKGGKISNANSAQERSALKNLDDDDEVFDHAANALANLCASLLLMLSMEKIVLGGGLMSRDGLLEKIQKRTVELLNGYLPLPDDMGTLITTSKAGNDAGLQGAIVLAKHALTRGETPISKKENEEETEKLHKTMKQVAFNVGLWHGIIVGAIGAAAAFKLFLSRTRKS